MKAKVQWTFAPLNGLATDGEPWTCQRNRTVKRLQVARPPQGQGCPFGGPPEASEA